jgi:hypothetical protein
MADTAFIDRCDLLERGPRIGKPPWSDIRWGEGDRLFALHGRRLSPATARVLRAATSCGVDFGCGWRDGAGCHLDRE